jgi:hypothetical protein
MDMAIPWIDSDEGYGRSSPSNGLQRPGWFSDTDSPRAMNYSLKAHGIDTPYSLAGSEQDKGDPTVVRPGYIRINVSNSGTMGRKGSLFEIRARIHAAYIMRNQGDYHYFYPREQPDNGSALVEQAAAAFVQNIFNSLGNLAPAHLKGKEGQGWWQHITKATTHPPSKPPPPPAPPQSRDTHSGLLQAHYHPRTGHEH